MTLPTGESEPITSVMQNGIATITFNRPEKLNSFNMGMATALLNALKTASADTKARVIVIAATGKAFCAGQDLSEVLPKSGEKLDLGRIVAESYNPIIRAIAESPKPVIAAVNGVAAGAGANLALACDFVIAGESASFIQAFARVGLIPDSGGTYFLPRILGLARAKAMTMLGEKISSKELLALGAIYKVVPDTEVSSAASELAAKLAIAATGALGLTKKLLNASFDTGLTEQLAAEEQAQRECGYSEDYSIGVTAFTERKTPNFTGR